MTKSLLIGTLLCLALHIAFGWAFAVIGAIIGGYLYKKGGWKIGIGAMFLSWGGLLLWNYVVAPQQTATLFQTMSALLGNLPAFAFPTLTLVLAIGLGGLGGLLGTQIESQLRR